MLVKIPERIPAKKEEMGLTIANIGPRREYVASIESTPVVGVEQEKKW